MARSTTLFTDEFRYDFDDHVRLTCGFRNHFDQLKLSQAVTVVIITFHTVKHVCVCAYVYVSEYKTTWHLNSGT